MTRSITITEDEWLTIKFDLEEAANYARDMATEADDDEERSQWEGTERIRRDLIASLDKRMRKQ